MNCIKSIGLSSFYLSRIFSCMTSARLIMMLLTMFSITVLNGQDTISPPHSNIFGLDLRNNQIKENILLPKAHKGPFIGLSYRYENENRNFQEFAFNIGYSRLKTNLETEKATWNGQIDAGYSYGKSLLPGEKVKYYLGANLNYNLGVMEYPVWDESRAYWGTSVSAGPFNRLNISMKNKCSWISSFHVNFLGIMSRPPDVRLYAQEKWTFLNIMKITNSEFSPGILNNILICNFKTEYRIPFRDNNFLSVSGSVFYETLTKREGQPLQVLRTSAGIGIGF